MVIILIRRCIRPEKEAEFIARYKSQTPNHPDFISETLTKVTSREDLPEPMRNLPIACGKGVTYINVAVWKSAESFAESFPPKKTHEPDIECEDRLRMVLEAVASK
jgi:hypothetical protein